MKYFESDTLLEVRKEGVYYVVGLTCGVSINTDSITLGAHYGYLPDDVVLACEFCNRGCKPGYEPCALLDFVSPAG